VHYRPSATNSAVLDNNKIHLLDSGGQYFDGTTDVTRAFHFGTPTQEEKEAYTRVLLGNLDIERLEWPQGLLNGAQIDVLARRHLWRRRWDYQHGTGHGVGYFGAVH
jgi:Xaa-Pro aminopeptidase